MLIYTKLNKVLPLIGSNFYYQAIIPSSTSSFCHIILQSINVAQ